MYTSKDYRFIAFIDELTPAQKEILAKIIRKNGTNCTCKIKFKKSFNMSKDTIARAKARLTELKIIKKIEGAFTYHVNPAENWDIQIKDKPETFIKWFDRTPEYMQESCLTRTEYRVYSRIYGSTSAKHYWEVRKKIKTIAKEINITMRAAQIAAQKLESYNLILRERSKYDTSRHRPYKYIITTPNLWSQEFIDGFPNEVKPQIIEDLVNTLCIEYNCTKPVVIQAIQNCREDIQKGKRISLKLPLNENVKKRSDSTTHHEDSGDDSREKKGLIWPLSIENSLLELSLLRKEDSNLSSFYSAKSLLNDTVQGNDKKITLNKKLFKTLDQGNNNKTLDQGNNKKPFDRNKFKNAHKQEADKFAKKTQVIPTRKTTSILHRWFKLCSEYPKIYTRPKVDQANKTYRDIVDALNKLFRGTLYQTNKVILPEQMKPFKHKFTLKEVETFLERLHIQMIDQNIGVNPFGKRKANLKEFLLGNPGTGASSKLLSCCWKEPTSLKIKHKDEVETLKNIYRQLVDPDKVFSFRDLEAFDKCASWAVPYSKSLESFYPSNSGFDGMIYRCSVKSAQKVANGSVNPSIFGKEFIERMTKQRMVNLGYTQSLN